MNKQWSIEPEERVDAESQYSDKPSLPHTIKRSAPVEYPSITIREAFLRSCCFSYNFSMKYLREWAYIF